MSKIIQQLKQPMLLRLYLWRHLPAAAFMGLQLERLDAGRAIVRLPFRWRSQNPFKSIYFAAQSAAAEFASGVLVLVALDQRTDVSMLVASVEGRFLKKANQTLRFDCAQGKEIQHAIAAAIAGTTGQNIKVTVTGFLPDGEVAAEFLIEWSFKKRSDKATN